MAENINKGSGWRGLVRNLCFIAFGTTIFSNPLDRFNLYYIGFGIVICVVFGWFFKRFLKGFLALFNPSLKKEQGKKVIAYAVDTGMLFLVPFATMSLIATYFLQWTLTGGFISTGIMAVGTASAIEIGKLKEKQEIKNTIITSGVAFVFSFILTFSAQILIKAPGLIEGIAAFLPSIMSKGGGAI